jgi:phi13 family phage major tail protein
MQIYEYRGVEGLVYAPITADTAESFSTGTVKPLAGVAEIAKTTDSTNEPHYYDNIPAVVVSSTGSDEITITASAIPLDTLAEITGQGYDETTGMFIEQERTPGYFAIGYQTKDTNGNVYYVWRLKGTFNIPDQTNATEDDGTDANGQELVFTGINTTHKFTKTGKSAKSITVNTGLQLADTTDFFTAVQTPDSIQARPITPSVIVTPATASVQVGNTVNLSVVTYPAGAEVTWSSSAETYATVSNSGVVTGVAEGTATITATITVDGESYTGTCVVTVTAAQA